MPKTPGGYDSSVTEPDNSPIDSGLTNSISIEENTMTPINQRTQQHTQESSNNEGIANPGQQFTRIQDSTSSSSINQALKKRRTESDARKLEPELRREGGKKSRKKKRKKMKRKTRSKRRRRRRRSLKHQRGTSS